MRLSKVVAVVVVGSVTTIVASGCTSTPMENPQKGSAELSPVYGPVVHVYPPVCNVPGERTTECKSTKTVVAYEISVPQSATCNVLSPKDANGNVIATLTPSSPTPAPGLSATPSYDPGTYVCRYPAVAGIGPDALCEEATDWATVYDVSYVLKESGGIVYPPPVVHLPPKVYFQGQIIESRHLPPMSYCKNDGGVTSCDTCLVSGKVSWP